MQRLIPLAYFILILQQGIIAAQGPSSPLHSAVGNDWKGKLSLMLYVIAIPLAFQWRWLALSIYVLVAVIWFIPDRRIERVVGQAHGSRHS